MQDLTDSRESHDEALSGAIPDGADAVAGEPSSPLCAAAAAAVAAQGGGAGADDIDDDGTICELNKPQFKTDEFRLFKFKIESCRNVEPHDWCLCPYAHPGEVEAERGAG